MTDTTVPLTRPAPLKPTGVPAPDGVRFPWGPIDAVHSISGIDVVEYRCDKSNHSAAQPDAWREHGKVRFHPFIDGRDTNRSYYSLDSALVGAIAIRRLGYNSEAAHHFDLITLGTIIQDAD